MAVDGESVLNTGRNLHTRANTHSASSRSSRRCAAYGDSSGSTVSPLIELSYTVQYIWCMKMTTIFWYSNDDDLYLVMKYTCIWEPLLHSVKEYCKKPTVTEPYGIEHIQSNNAYHTRYSCMVAIVLHIAGLMSNFCAHLIQMMINTGPYSGLRLMLCQTAILRCNTECHVPYLNTYLSNNRYELLWQDVSIRTDANILVLKMSYCSQLLYTFRYATVDYLGTILGGLQRETVKRRRGPDDYQHLIIPTNQGTSYYHRLYESWSRRRESDPRQAASVNFVNVSCVELWYCEHYTDVKERIQLSFYCFLTSECSRYHGQTSLLLRKNNLHVKEKFVITMCMEHARV